MITINVDKVRQNEIKDIFRILIYIPNTFVPIETYESHNRSLEYSVDDVKNNVVEKITNLINKEYGNT